MADTDITLIEALETWREELSALSSLAAKTASEHVRHLFSFGPDLASAMGKDMDEVTLDSIKRVHLVKAFAAWRKSPDGRFKDSDSAPKERSASSAARRLAAIRSFFLWCVDTGLLDSSPAVGLKSPTPPRRIPKTLSEAEARLVLTAASSSRFAKRDRLLVLFCLTMGLTLQEVSSLTLSSLSSDRSVVRVAGRAGKERDVAIPSVVQDALVSYLELRAEILERYDLTSSSLFISMRPHQAGLRAGEPVLSLDTSYVGLGDALTRILRRAGVSTSYLRSHALRATFASLALESSAYTVGELQSVMGYESLEALRSLARSKSSPLGKADLHPLAGS